MKNLYYEDRREEMTDEHDIIKRSCEREHESLQFQKNDEVNSVTCRHVGAQQYALNVVIDLYAAGAEACVVLMEFRELEIVPLIYLHSSCE